MSLGSGGERQSGIKANDACYLDVVERLRIMMEDSLFGLVADPLLSPKLGDAVNLRRDVEVSIVGTGNEAVFAAIAEDIR